MTSYIGQVKLFAFNFIPKGWLECNGSLLEIVDYEPLFEYIGRVYGDTRVSPTQFKLPDLRGVVPIHHGRGAGLSNNYERGKTAGSAAYTMKAENLPQHTHAAVTPVHISPPCSTDTANTPSPVNAYPAATPGSNTYAAAMTGSSCITPLNASNVNVQPTGGNLPFSLIQPCMGLRYCICYSGIFPTKPD